MSLDLGKFYKSLERFVDNNPELITKLGLSIPVIMKMIKNGTLKTIMLETVKGVRGGFTVKAALSNAITSSATTSAISKGISVAGIAAAAAFAFGTLKEAVKYGEATIKGDDTGWDKIWKFAWNTSIPGATVNQFRSFANWLKSKPSQPAEKQRWATDPLPPVKKTEDELKEAKAPILDKVSFTGEKNKVSAYSGINYDEAAKSLGLGTRPANPQAENEWKKEVERMSKKTQPNKFNGPKWYFQGYAKKLMGANLTWTGYKRHGLPYPFVAATAFKVDLMLPQNGDRTLHDQVISNTNIMWQALRGKNTGAFNYAEEDVFTYNWTLYSLIATYRFVCKLIALSNKRDVEIESLPVMLLAAHFCSRLGTNTGRLMYDDIITNKSSYVTQLNAIAKDINTYALKDVTLISRWNYLADKCLKDFNGPKAVYGYYTLDNVVTLTSNGIGYCEVGGKTIAQLIAYLRSQLDLIRTYNNGVLLKVAGDMIKLLGAKSETFANVPYINGAEVPEFPYDPEAFDQIRNAKAVPMYFATAPSYDHSVKGDIYTPIAAPTGNASLSSSDCILLRNEYIITSDRNKEFQPEENVQMVQFCFNAEVDTDHSVANGFSLRITDCPVSRIGFMSIVQWDYTNGDPITDTICSICTLYNGSTTSAILINGVADTLHGDPNSYYTNFESITRQIDFMPRMQFTITKASQSAFLSVAHDVDNYAFMTPRQFEQFNNVAVYSLTYAFNPEDIKIMGILA